RNKTQLVEYEDRFLCSICLDVFTDPVTTSCGHNFCKKCITQYWDVHERCQCPLCKETFKSRPQLKINTFISEMVAQFRRESQQKEAHLELFCKIDQTCVCMLCSVLDHKAHEFVPLKEEYEGKKAELEKTEAEIQQMIQKRRLKIQEIKESVKMRKDAADRQKAEGVQVLTALMESVERRLKELIKEIEDKQETTEKQAEGLIKDLEQEISELMERSSEVEQLSRSEDHLHLLQSFSSLKAAAELKRVQQDAVDVTLDPDTANPDLILSDDGKQVNHGDVRRKLPDNPERFSQCVCVLGEQSFSSGRFYFEVQVKGKTKWTLGVSTESINRKGKIRLRPQNGLWTVCLRNGSEYKACAAPPVRLSLRSGPQKVGVFVDYEEGLVSFYDVDAAALIYSFTGCSFTEKLHPYLNPCNNDDGKNAAPLLITAVDLILCEDRLD
uniref:Bloodthirsty-related gene family, member 2 n=1 Tax=Maylandia zebra TaxID=106582 RepID=A0A3P9C7B6_9CICH